MVCLENVVLVVSPCLPFPSATRRGDTGDFRGRSCFASCGYDHLQIGGYMWGLTDRGGVSVAVEVASVFAMLPVLVVLARTAIASVVLAPMVVLVEAGAMVAVASVVAGAMVVARSAGGISPIYGGRRRGLASRWGGRSSMCCSICAIVRARGSGVSRGCGAPIRRSRCRDSY